MGKLNPRADVDGLQRLFVRLRFHQQPAGEGLHLAQADLDAGRLVQPFDISSPVDFAYFVVHPKAKGRLSQVRAFVAWILAEAEAHERDHRTIDMGAGI